MDGERGGVVERGVASLEIRLESPTLASQVRGVFEQRRYIVPGYLLLLVFEEIRECKIMQQARVDCRRMKDRCRSLYCLDVKGRPTATLLANGMPGGLIINMYAPTTSIAFACRDALLRATHDGETRLE